MVLRKIIIKKDDFSVDGEALKVFRKYRCHPVYGTMGIPQAEEEGADTDGDDEEVEEDDHLGVVALARQVGGTLQPGRRHVQAQRHLLHTGGWECTQALRERKSPIHFFGA